MIEAALAEAVIEYLEADGWDVYQEVTIGGSRADIVAVRGPLVHIVEAKTALSFDVVAQAVAWRRYAHVRSVAVPLTCTPSGAPKRLGPGRYFAERLLRDLEIGMITVRRMKNYDSKARRLVPVVVAREEFGGWLNRHAPNASMVRALLRPEHKTAARAGTNTGGQWTPFRETCRSLTEVVQENPGITLRAAIERLRVHHYSNDKSAHSSLAHWIERGKIAGVEMRQEGKARLLYPKAGA